LRRWLKRWWWAPLIVVVALLLKAALVGAWLQGVVRDEAALASGLPVERIEVDGFDVTLTGFTDENERNLAVAAVEALESTDKVAGEMLAGAPAAPAAPAADDSDSAGLDSDAGADSDDTESDSDDEASAPDLDGDGADGDDGDDGDEASVADDDDDDESSDLPTPSIVVGFDGDMLLLQGTLADEATKAALVEGLRARFGLEVDADDLTVDAGTVAADGGTLVLSGEVDGDDEREARLTDLSAVAQDVGYDVADEMVVVKSALNALTQMSSIEFGERQDSVSTTSQVTLDEAAALINENPDGTIQVVGHTDSDGCAERNLELGARRAQAVVDYLVSQGVDLARLQAISAGEEELLISPELSADDKQRNRRIEWRLVS